MEIILETKRDIVIKESEIFNTDTITVNQVTDFGTSVIAMISVGDKLTPKVKYVVFWEAYLLQMEVFVIEE